MGRLRIIGEKTGCLMSSNILLSHESKLLVRKGVREEVRREAREGLRSARGGVGMEVMW